MTTSVARRDPAAIDHELLWASVGVLAAVLAWAVTRSPVPILPTGCLFKAVTGWPCVTCGGTRALRALMDGEIAAGFRANPLVTAVSAVWWAYGVYALGALCGGWPRVRVRLEDGEATLVRIMAVLAVAATWLFLIVDGR